MFEKNKKSLQRKIVRMENYRMFGNIFFIQISESDGGVCGEQQQQIII